MLIDTHAHLNFAAFDKDRKEVIKRCLDNNIWVVNIGTNLETSRKAVAIAENYKEGVLASVGLHPINLETGLVKIKIDPKEGKHFEVNFDYGQYKKLASSEKVVAIGEIGFDYYWKPKTKRKKELFKQRQKELLYQELSLAKELNLPVIFHCRMAHQDLIEFLRQSSKVFPERAVAHSFVGGINELKDFLNLGFYIGFNGIIYKNIEGVNFKEAIRYTPLERILVETDCPYLIPPEVKKERNEPVFVKYIAQTIADVKKISLGELADVTTKNAKKLFKI